VRGNILGIFFSILSGVLIFLIVVAYGRSDRIAPEFRFSATDIIYDSQTTDNNLKVGINAYDSKDGDLTSRIVVEKVVLNREKETAVVYYAVADYSGNVTKQSRVFPADIADIDSFGDSSETMEDPMFPNIAEPETESISGEEETSTGEQEAGEEASSTENSAGNQEP
jgi:hypothetical protein